MNYTSPWPMIRGAAEALRPPQRVSVSQGAAEALVIRQSGGYSGSWSPTETPYMVEPMDMLASRKHHTVCFVGPARAGKTMGLLDGWFAHNVTCDPGDMLIVQMSQQKAREFGKRRIDGAIFNSPKIKALMTARNSDDNTHDKLFKHGMWVHIGWLSASQLASLEYRYVALTDYDKFPDNIGAHGSGYQQGLKRTETFLSRGMCMVESSPGREWTDPLWRPSAPHEAPPVTGILGIYNRSDRRRWYWQCPDCKIYFEAKPGMELFSTLPDESELIDIVRTENLLHMASTHASVVCVECGSIIEQKWKPYLNDINTARWVADGQTVNRDGVVIGEVPVSRIAGYWLGGIAAAYQKWDSLVLNYLQGLREYVLSGSEETLKTTVNGDQGMPYLPMHLKADCEQDIEDRKERLDRYFVPDAARFLVASADVQGGSQGRFVCEVRAFGEHLESWLVDRFSITTTDRNGQPAQVDPAGYPEDWDLLTEKLVTATYRTHAGKELRILRTAVDTGGEEGTTPNAYAWYRRLRKQNLTARVMLIKGGSNKQESPVVRGHARNNTGKRMHDLPIWIVATDYYKDIIAASLRRTVPGPGYFHAPDWLHQSYFDELKAETRLSSGKWKQIRARNESLDLWVYALATCESLGCGAKGSLSWDCPPEWALPLNKANSELIMPEERRTEKVARSSRKKSLGSPDWSSRL